MLNFDLLFFHQDSRRGGGALRQAVTFAFATADTSGSIEDALVRDLVQDTSWDPACFAKDLFLDALVESNFRLETGSPPHPVPVHPRYVKAVLSAPPRAADVVERRQRICFELSHNRALFDELTGYYARLSQLKDQLCTGYLGRRENALRRRLEILNTAHEIAESLGGGCATSKTDLRQLPDVINQHRSSAGYRRLTDLLQYEGDSVRVQVRLHLGADGRLRSLDLLPTEENRDNTFYRSPLIAFLRRLSLLIRGYGFTNGELMGTLIESVYQGVEPLLLELLRVQAQLGVYLGAVGFFHHAKAQGLPACLPRFVLPGKGRIELQQVFNPLLLPQGRPSPCDIRLERSDSTVLLTGPNSGGKTRLLQAIALCQLLGQGGFFIPAKQATLTFAPALHVSLGEGIVADQREGRLGTELLRVRRLFESLRPGSVVMIDELCSGTNPAEGERIFRLVLSLIAPVKTSAFVTTHYLDCTARLAKTQEVPNLEFLQAELDEHQIPTYTFKPGVAESSLANQTASRLGVTEEELQTLVTAALAKDARLPGATEQVPRHPEDLPTLPSLAPALRVS